MTEKCIATVCSIKIFNGFYLHSSSLKFEHMIILKLNFYEFLTFKSKVNSGSY